MLGTTWVIKQFADQGEGVAILDYQVVKPLIIYVQDETTASFLNKWYWSASGGLGKPDETAN